MDEVSECQNERYRSRLLDFCFVGQEYQKVGEVEATGRESEYGTVDVSIGVTNSDL